MASVWMVTKAAQIRIPCNVALLPQLIAALEYLVTQLEEVAVAEAPPDWKDQAIGRHVWTAQRTMREAEKTWEEDQGPQGETAK